MQHFFLKNVFFKKMAVFGLWLRVIHKEKSNKKVFHLLRIFLENKFLIDNWSIYRIYKWY